MRTREKAVALRCNSDKSFGVERFPAKLNRLAGIFAVAICLLAAPVWAVCPAGTETGPLPFYLVAGDSCSRLSAGTGGIINAPGVTVTFSSVSPAVDYAVEAIGGGVIKFTDNSTITADGTAHAVLAKGPGSEVDVRNGTIITLNDPGTAIEMSDSGLVYIDHTTNILLDGDSGGYGISIANTTVPSGVIGPGIIIHSDSPNGGDYGLEVTIGSIVTIEDLTVQGPGAEFAVYANGGSHLTLTGLTTLTTESPGGVTLEAAGAGTVIDGDITTKLIITSEHDNTNSAGVFASYGGQVLIPTTMYITTTSGNGSAAVWAMSPGSFVDATHGTQIEVEATNGYGVKMLDNGYVKLDSTTGLFIDGSGSTGVELDGAQVPNGTIGAGLIIHLNGSGEIGLWATLADAPGIDPAAGPSTITVDDLTVTGNGARVGLVVDSDSVITATNSNITINGQNGSALEVMGGTINFTDSTAIALGAARAAATAAYPYPSTFNITGSTLNAPESTGIVAFSGIVNVNISNSTVTGGTADVAGGNGTLVSAVDASTLLGLTPPNPSDIELVATNNSKLFGAATVDATSTLDMTLTTGTAWTMTGDSSLVTNLTNATTATINFVQTDATLTTNVDYTGGGTLVMSGVLNGGSTPTLIVHGDTSGTTTIKYAPAAGSVGADTSGLNGGDGVLVVEVDGASNGVFNLAGGSFVLDGFTYKLVKGTANPKNWYLQAFAGRSPASAGTAIPALDNTALILLALLLAIGAMVGQRRNLLRRGV